MLFLLLSGQRNPVMSIFCYQCLSVLRSPATRSIIWKVNRFPMRPSVHYGFNDTPGSIHLVGPHEQGWVTFHHVLQQCFICLWFFFMISLSITEYHIDGT